MSCKKGLKRQMYLNFNITQHVFVEHANPHWYRWPKLLVRVLIWPVGGQPDWLWLVPASSGWLGLAPAGSGWLGLAWAGSGWLPRK